MIYIVYEVDVDGYPETKFVSDNFDKARAWIIKTTEALPAGTKYNYELRSYQPNSEKHESQMVFSSENGLFENTGLPSNKDYPV